MKSWPAITNYNNNNIYLNNHTFFLIIAFYMLYILCEHTLSFSNIYLFDHKDILFSDFINVLYNIISMLILFFFVFIFINVNLWQKYNISTHKLYDKCMYHAIFLVTLCKQKKILFRLSKKYPWRGMKKMWLRGVLQEQFFR